MRIIAILIAMLGVLQVNAQCVPCNILLAKDRIHPYIVRMEVDDPEGIFTTYDINVNDTVYYYNEGLTVYVVNNVYAIRNNEANVELLYVDTEYPFDDYRQWPSIGRCVLLKSGRQYHYVAGIDEQFQEALSRRASGIITSLGDKTYYHVQTVSSDVWTIHHNMGKYPCVNVFNEGGVMIFYSYIEYVDLNTVLIHFSIPTTGVVYLN